MTGHHRIVEKRGGGMGVVYEAKDTKAGAINLILGQAFLQLKPSCNYCGVINRIGTGELPDTVGVDAVAVLLQPVTLSTVTFRLPFESTPLMNTCKKPTIVTGDWLTPVGKKTGACVSS